MNDEIEQDLIQFISNIPPSIKTQVLVHTELSDRALIELPSLNKFSGLNKIEEILGPVGCFIFECKSDRYTILTERTPISEIKQEQILAAAVPVSFILREDLYNRAMDIVFHCLNTKIPIFLISQPFCTLYNIWITKEKDQKYLQYICSKNRTINCPGAKETVNAYSCKAKEEGFCKILKESRDPAQKGKSKPGELSPEDRLINFLEKIGHFTNDKSYYPIFELSDFIKYCLAEHHLLDLRTKMKEKDRVDPVTLLKYYGYMRTQKMLDRNN